MASYKGTNIPSGSSQSQITKIIRDTDSGSSSSKTSNKSSSSSVKNVANNPLVFDTPAYAAQFGQKTPTLSSSSKSALEKRISSYSSANPDTQALANAFTDYIKANPAVPVNDVMQPATPIAVPQPPKTENYQTTIESNNQGLGLNADGTTRPATVTPTNTSEALLAQFGLSLQAPQSAGDAYLKAQKSFDIKAKEQAVNDYSAQINAITAKSQADQLAATGQGRGITESIIGGQQAQIAKEAAIRALPIQAQLAAAQGNLAMAKENLDTYYKIVSQDIQNQYAYQTKLFDVAFSIANTQQQNAIEDKRQQAQFAQQEKMERLNYQHQVNLKSIGLGQPEAPKIVSVNGVDSIWDATSGRFIKAPTSGIQNTSNQTVVQENLQRVNSLLSDTGSIKAASGQVQGKKGIIGSLFNPVKTLFSPVQQAKDTFNTLTGKNLSAYDDFLTKSNKIINDQTFSKLTQLKAGGATFGSLTEGERIAIGKAASDFAAAAQFDKNGNVIGFRGSEQQLKDNLAQIQKGYLTEQDIINAQSLGTDDLLEIFNN